MDHLSYPQSTDINHLCIPYLCDGIAEYDGGPFSAYPFRQGWAHRPHSLQWLRCSDNILARRVQVWLYFGLLSEFCGCVIPQHTFRCADGLTGTPRLSTIRLPQLVDTHKHTKWKRNLNDCRKLLEEALRLSDLVEARITSMQGPLSLVSCSVRALIQSLNSAQGLRVKTINSIRRYQAGRRWPLRFSTDIIEGWKISVAKAIILRMADLGWCPAQIADFKSKYSCNMIYYISGLPINGGLSHARCDEFRCSAYNIDESCYIPRHASDCLSGNCDLVEVTAAAVAAIIDDRHGIPLLSCSLSGDRQIRMEVIRAETGKKYIAVSHVWSGGLGNPIQNGLPKCEVRQLAHRLGELQTALSKCFEISEWFSSEKPTLFWMDTFCIPIGESFRLSRRMAINSMAEIFSGAVTVLVLDPELQRLSYAGMKPEQSLAHVLCSSWMSRCWTLLEASLAKSWYIQFNDRAVDMVKTMVHCRTRFRIELWMSLGKIQPSMTCAFGEETSSFLMEMGEVRYQRRGRYSRSEIWNLKQLQSHQAYTFSTTWNNFLGRTTSKVEDLHQMLAVLEDMRGAKVRDLPVGDRMKAILKCHATLPIDLLFCKCERMRNDEAVNTWAPKLPEGSRLEDSFGTMQVFTNFLFISKKMVAEHLGLFFVPSKYLHENKFQIELPNSVRLIIQMHTTGPSQNAYGEDRLLCLMFSVSNTQPDLNFSSESRGARFLVREEEGDDLYMGYEGSFRIYASEQDDQSVPIVEYRCSSVEGKVTTNRIFIDCGKFSP